MNHPRRFLLLIPLALSGAALLVRSRVPRPHTASDKWLWEKAEQAKSLSLAFDDIGLGEAGRFQSGSDGEHHVIVKERAGIRAIVRAFENTPRFTHLSPPSDENGINPLVIIVMDLPPTQSRDLYLYHAEGRYYLTHGAGLGAIIEPDAATKVIAAVQSATLKARHKQPGYTIYTGGP